MYKYYRADTGKILYIQKKGDDGSEEELSQFDDAEFDLQISEMNQQVQQDEEAAKNVADQYKPDPEQLVRELHVCIPYGERQVIVEMRKLIVNATEGRIDEYNDQNALVCSHDLRHLVTYIIPDSSTIDSIYKCVILLFSEPDVGQAEDALDEP